MTTKQKLQLAAGVLIALAACGGRVGANERSDPLCVPGQQVRCACLDGSTGVQVCSESGYEFEPCQCGKSQGPTGSSSPSGGASPAGSTSGRAGASRGGSGSGGRGGSSSSGPKIDATSTALSYGLVDAEYSRALDKIVLLSNEPDELHVVDPVSGLDVAVTLPLAGSAVSVAPDGKHAVVGHDGWVSVVDLVGFEVTKTLTVSCDALDVVLANNGYAYVFPVRDQWSEIHSVNLEDEVEEEYTGMSIYAGTLAKLQPGADAIYGADNGLSPSDIEKYDISPGAAAYLYDSPYHGDYSMCGDLWFSEDGETLFTRCGNVFSASELRELDMKYKGALDTATDTGTGIAARIVHLTHSSAAHKVVAILGSGPSSSWEREPGGTSIRVYEDVFLKPERTIPVGSLSGSVLASHCAFAFVNDAGDQIFALCSMGTSPNLSHAVFSFAL